ncbi:MAG: inositol 2-dehydrogenase [Alphaproteobacteria bacterium]
MKIALFGAGRIGKVHAIAIANNARASLACVVDPHEPSAKALADQYNVPVMSESQALEDGNIDAVLIGSPTDQHARQITDVAESGKAIFCEKPIDLDISRVRAVLNQLDRRPVPFMLGFNRRFDPNFVLLKQQIDSGVIGNVEMVTILSRDPGLPPIDYVKTSGGIFKDMMIHDFDMARFLVGEEFIDVQAMGAVHIDANVAKAGDYDTAIATLRTASGKLVSISNSRRATYGYDQRIEVHGSNGMLQADNVRESTVVLSNGDGVRLEKPMHFFLERYEKAYANEIDAFVRLVIDKDESAPNASDGLRALELAELAVHALA